MGIRLQSRDLAILELLGELGCLDTESIRERFFSHAKTDEACARRLRDLKKSGHIESHEPPHNTRSDGKAGKQSSVHRLTPLGAEAVQAKTGNLPKRVARSDAPNTNSLLHRVGIAKSRLAIDDAFAAADLPSPEWIHEYDMNPGVAVDAVYGEKYRLYEAFRVGGKRVTCWADAAARFRLHGTPYELLAYLEYDRSTMTHGEIEEKLWGYYGFFEASAWHRHWENLDRYLVRILFACLSQQRVDSLCDDEAIRKHPAARHCRFAVEADLRQDSMLHSPIWRTVDGELLPLLKSSTPPSNPLG